MVTLGIWPEGDFKVSDSLLVSLIAIVMVFFVLALLIVFSFLISKGADKVSGITSINAREENKLLDEDPDAAIAVLTATIDFNKETGKNANIVSVSRIEE